MSGVYDRLYREMVRGHRMGGYLVERRTSPFMGGDTEYLVKCRLCSSVKILSMKQLYQARVDKRKSCASRACTSACRTYAVHYSKSAPGAPKTMITTPEDSIFKGQPALVSDWGGTDLGTSDQQRARVDPGVSDAVRALLAALDSDGFRL